MVELPQWLINPLPAPGNMIEEEFLFTTQDTGDNQIESFSILFFLIELVLLPIFFQLGFRLKWDLYVDYHLHVNWRIYRRFSS